MPTPTREAWVARATELLDWLKDGKIKTKLTSYPLADGSAAHSDLESRRSTGKLVLVP